MSHENLDFSSKVIHIGQEPSQWNSRAIVPPISNAVSFEQSVESLFDDDARGSKFSYSRNDNPTRKCLELSLAAMEEANYALTFSSGMGATLTITHLLKSGDHIICSDGSYGGTSVFFLNCLPRFNITTTFVDATDVKNIERALQLNTRLVWLETPTNPFLYMIDLKKSIELIKCRSNEIIIVVDSTLMTPYNQKPLQFGADISLHSLSKYINGHADVIMGSIATNSRDIYNNLLRLQSALGAIPSPNDCFMVNRGLKTLHLRMDAQMKNALSIAQYLLSHPMVKKVIHPGLESHPHYELGKRQCSGYNGMLSFYINGGTEEVKLFLKNLKLFVLAGSFGSVQSLVQIPARTSHKYLGKSSLIKYEIDDTLIRLSCGIESTKDLIDDLVNALEAARNPQFSHQSI